jgi:hypothetical protein
MSAQINLFLFKSQIEEMIESLPRLLDALNKVRAFVTALKQRAMSRRELLDIQRDQGEAQPLCPMMGTINR